MSLTVSARRMLVALLVVVATLTVISVTVSVVRVTTDAAPFRGFDRLDILFNTDREANVPTWFSSGLLLTAALLLWGTATAASSRPWRRRWLLLAAAFTYLSLDELSQLHELATPIVRGALGTGGVLTFGWVVLAFPLLVAFALLYVGFLRALPRRTALLFVASGTLFVGGALGVELLGGWAYATSGRESVAFVLASSVEELCEMVGVSFFVYAIADHQQRFVRRDDGVRAEDASAVPALARQSRPAALRAR